MKSLVIYYSLEGNTRFLAKNMAKALGADLLELKPKKDISSKGMMRFFWGGKQIVQNKSQNCFPLIKTPRTMIY